MGTSSFLEGELAAQRERLEEMDRNLRDYRRKYMGELPEQLETNLRIMSRVADELSEKQKQLRDAKNRLIALSQFAGPEPDEEESTVQSIDLDDLDNITDLSQLKKKLESLLSRYTDVHPDVVRVQKRVKELEDELKEAAIDPEAAQKGDLLRDMTQDSRQREMEAQLQLQRAQIKNEIATLEVEIKETKALIKQYQKRVENTPKREEELRALTRDYRNIQDSCSQLLNRKLNAELSLSMERKQKGEQFRIIDRARKPEKPVAPDLKKLFLIVIAAGLGIGCGAIFLIDYFDSSMKHPEEFEEELGLTVMAMIPTIHHSRFHILTKLNFVFTILGLIAAAGLLSVFAVSTVLKGPAGTIEFLSKIKGIIASVI